MNVLMFNFMIHTTFYFGLQNIFSVFLEELLNVELKHQIISGKERALLWHGSLAAEILNSMKQENIVSPWVIDENLI